MRIDGASQAVLEWSYTVLERHARQAGREPVVRYLDCGTRIVRLICHTPAFLHHVERQMSCSLREDSPSFDATIIIWQERNIMDVALGFIGELDEIRYRKLRIERIAKRGNIDIESINIYNDDIINKIPIVCVNSEDGSICAFDFNKNTYYYAIESMEIENIMKRGHIFVEMLFRICRVPGSSLAHGAVVGLNGVGILFCAFGYQGKSTLAVHALLEGFEYVSDDYLVLGMDDEGILRAWPLYSIVALSPHVYQTIYDNFKGKFIGGNARGDKYIFNISAYHENFRSCYPISLCMIPNICKCHEPSIEPGFKEVAIGNLAFSTVENFGMNHDAVSICRLYDFVHELPFYRFNLSHNLSRNIRCLRSFIERIK